MPKRRRQPLYVVPGPHPGLLIRGNLDINNRPLVKNRGGISTVYTTSFETTIDGRKAEVLVPQVVNGKIVSPRQAYLHFLKTGEHLGIFDSVYHANAYSVRLHRQQARLLQKDLKSGLVPR